MADLEREGLVGPGWDNFSADERAIASWLRVHGLEVVSVRASRIDRRNTPDAVFGGRDETVEFKTLARASVTAVARNIREGRSQSRRLVIDGRRAGLQKRDAIAGLAQALRRHTADLDEVVVLLRDASALHWP